MSRLLARVLMLGLLAGQVQGWTPSTVASSPLKAIKWSGGAVGYRVNTTHGSNIQGSNADVQAAVDAGFLAWGAVSNTSLFITNGGASASTTRNSADHINTVLFADTASTAQEAGLIAGALAVTFTIFDPSAGLFIDGDIVFNTNQNFFTTTTSSSAFDLQSVVTHEIGHLIGLDHASLLTATMYHSTAQGSTFQRQLSSDDIAGIRSTYPGSTALGKISGRIRNGASGVLGASVFATSTQGIAAAATISQDSAGTFSIAGLPAGSYSLGVEPLDLPMQQGNLGGFYQVIGAFSTTFGTRLPQGTFVVSNGQTTNAGDLDVSAGTTAINPQNNICIVNAGAGSFLFSSTVNIDGGTTGKELILRHTSGITGATAVSVTGSDVTLGTATSGNLTGGVTFRRFPLTVSSSATTGSRSILFSDGANSAAYAGGFLVTGTSAPNTAPSATATTTNTVFNLGDTVNLAGNASDADGDVLSYSWTPTSGTFGTLQNSTSLNALFIAAGSGSFTFQLQASDNKGGSGTGSVGVRINAPPVPSVASALTGTTGVEVTLSGSASDTDGDSITSYTWTQTGGTTISLTGSSTSVARFTPSLAGSYTFTLAVRDSAGGKASSGTVTVTVSPPPNRAPTAQATGLGAILQDEAVTLDGSSSSDPDNDALTYAWSQLSGPATLSLGVTNRTTVGFSTSVIGSYLIRLTVMDPSLATSSADLTVRVDRRPIAPIAEAGADRTVSLGSIVRLDGSSSRDPSGQTLSYLWKQVAGTSVTLSGTTTRVVTFVAATAGIYDFSFSVTNTDQLASTDFVRVISEAVTPSTTSMALATGLNVISLPLQPSTTDGSALTGAGLAKLTGSSFVARTQPGSVAKLRFQAYISGEARSEDFEIDGNQAYVLSVPQSKSVTLTGLAWPSISRQIPLQAGANLVGIPGAVSPTYTSASLAAESGGGLVAERVAGASGVSGGWRVFVSGSAPAGFALAPGKGYVVNAPAAVTVTIPAP